MLPLFKKHTKYGVVVVQMIACPRMRTVNGMKTIPNMVLLLLLFKWLFARACALTTPRCENKIAVLNTFCFRYQWLIIVQLCCCQRCAHRCQRCNCWSKNLIGTRFVFDIIGAIHNCRSKNLIVLGTFWRKGLHLQLFCGNGWEYFGGVYCCLGIFGNILEESIVVWEPLGIFGNIYCLASEAPVTSTEE